MLGTEITGLCQKYLPGAIYLDICTVHPGLKEWFRYSRHLHSLVCYCIFTSRDQGGDKDNESSSSIIFAEPTSEKEKPFGKSDIKNENNNLVSYNANLVIRNSSEFESSVELQENGLTDLSIGPIVKHHLPPGHNSDLEGNSTSTDESSEGNLSLLEQTEVVCFSRSCWGVHSPLCRICLCVASFFLGWLPVVLHLSVWFSSVLMDLLCSL